MPNENPPTDSKSKFYQPLATIVGALIGASAVIFVSFLNKPDKEAVAFARERSQVKESLEAQLRAPAGYQEKLYPTFGFGFLAPSAWKVEDAAASFGVPDIDVVQRYTSTKSAIGVEFKLIAVQSNYISDVVSELDNQVASLRRIDPNVKVEDAAVAGYPSKKFIYLQPSGARMGKVTVHWTRLIPQVRLQITSFTYLDEDDSESFWREAEAIVKSVVVDGNFIKGRHE